MSEQDEKDEPLEQSSGADDDQKMRDLLKRSLAPATPPPQKPVLREVQRKIRQRSKGKFYSDGWSTARSRVNYALVAVIMLLIVAIAYFAMGPTSFTK